MISMKVFRIFKCICLLSLLFPMTMHAQVKIGSNPTMIGTNANLEVEGANGSKISVSKDSGKLTIKDGSEGVGKVLTSDANGVATWVVPGATIESLPGTTGVPGVPGSDTPGAPATGITIVVNDSGTWIYNPTTASWTSINSQTGRVNIDASNGVMLDGQTIKLGGNLTEPTAIKSSAVNTLAISGLQDGKVTDDLLTMDPTTGVLRKISAVEFSMGTNMAKQKMVATAGEKVFPTVWPIDSLDKIQVYRNGAEIDFSATEGTSQITLQLLADTNGGCLDGDEIKIYQWK
ncbi:hypothetical protein [Flavobacterium gilvum]|uniref:Uncharacterized protein n=1 Tax=Flavobacterium gilvum TaxID=1492737 RepID=A0AAC9I5B4_9FLAO|nr:hypothetical protein [Flavobacterium gilvum]AOW10385.1 hypothetical protein EM308_13210 [Flavobacterium gilvum]KFC60251.1 hypothetical protein FEM08_09520 [Flavobacterium gilvum]